MSMIDRQRISAVKTLEAMGYTFADGAWRGAPPAEHLSAASDVLFGLLADRVDDLMGCTEQSPEEAELQLITATCAAAWLATPVSRFSACLSAVSSCAAAKPIRAKPAATI